MEVYSKTTRFAIACNDSDQIIGVFICQCVCYLYVDYVCCVEAENNDVWNLVFTMGAVCSVQIFMN